MTKHLLCILLVFAFLIQSCASINYPQTRSNVELKQDLSVINGDYRNFVWDTLYLQVSIWSILTKNYNYPNFSSAYDFSNSFVRLTAQGDKRVLAKLYVDNRLSQQKILKGRVKDRQFVLRTKRKCYGLPFVFLVYSDYKLQLSKDAANTLYIDGLNGKAAWFFIFTGGSNTNYNFKFPTN